MATNSRLSEVILKYQTDSASLKQTVQRAEQLRAELKQLRLEAGQVAIDQKRLSDTHSASVPNVQRLKQAAAGLREEYQALRQAADAKAYTEFGRRIAEGEDELRRAARQADQTAEAVKDLERAVNKTDRAFEGATGPADFEARLRQAREQADIYGSTSSRLAAFGRLTSGVAGPQAAGGLMLADDLFDAVEAAKLFRAELPELSRQMLTTGPVTSKLSGAIATLPPGMAQTAAKTALVVSGMAAMAGAAAVLMVAWGAAKKIIEQSAEATKEYMAAHQQVAELVTSGTSEEIQNAIEANKQRNLAAQYERDRLKDLIDAAEDLGGFKGALLDFNDALGLNLGGIEDVKDRYQELGNEIDTTNGATALLTKALGSTTVAANDAAAAEEQLALERQKQAEVILAAQREVTNSQITLAQRQRDWSAENVRSRLSDIEIERKAREDEIARLRTLEGAGIDTAAAIQENEIAIRKLNTEEQSLLTTVLPLAQARAAEAAEAERLTDSLTKSRDGLKDFLGALGDAAQQAADLAAKRQDLTAAFGEDTDKISAQRARDATREAQDFERKRLKDQLDFRRQQAQADAQYYRDRAAALEALADVDREAGQERLKEAIAYNKESARLAEDHANRLNDIQRDLDRGAEDAIRDRDARAYASALRQAKRATEDETRQYDLEQKRRGEDQAERLTEIEAERQERLTAARQALADLETQHQEQAQERQRAYDEARQAEDTERTLRLQRQQEDYAAQDAERQTAYDNQLAALQLGLSDQETAITTSMGKQTAAVQEGYNSMVAGAEQFKSRLSSLFTGSEPTRPRRRGFAGGGLAPVGEDIDVGEFGRETVRFLHPAMIYPHGVRPPSPTINLGGLGGIQVNQMPDQAAAEIARQVGTMVDQKATAAVLRAFQQMTGIFLGGD